ncbi:hypothetical protein SISSUDRAFT_220690 [Sistotremastrum suecicum HHB10207 ss-3]|uniref:Uncharacterized protein n=1 Tax=Sistotremastrum suecicum HHB10207 ss-3 TaxID=1314776 RepID=A0A166A5G5_9AGAM|nr:hypothetical protein SISSUDRAFT_220690 [Sistotremastrum suecicum HHB10207 ss-3]
MTEPVSKSPSLKLRPKDSLSCIARVERAVRYIPGTITQDSQLSSVETSRSHATESVRSFEKICKSAFAAKVPPM